MTTGKFSGSIANLSKTDNASGYTKAKINIRELVLAAIGAKAAVFDAFAGEGHMHDAVWHKAASYTGCDERFFADKRLAFVADNRRVLRALDLAQFNVFDLDAYGSPWEQAYIVARRRALKPGERIGVVITEGTGMKMKMGGIPRVLSMLSGIKAKPGLGKGDVQDDVIARAILRIAELMNASIERRWQATGKVGSRMVYCGLVLKSRVGP